ncbi:hypothetical protein HK098_002931 [Nowakowskiella sp. JEL0407]|nr:hypothetical protein HK098_002931 [Nowakowskiella sp. JEL0407]
MFNKDPSNKLLKSTSEPPKDFEEQLEKLTKDANFSLSREIPESKEDKKLNRLKMLQLPHLNVHTKSKPGSPISSTSLSATASANKHETETIDSASNLLTALLRQFSPQTVRRRKTIDLGTKEAGAGSEPRKPFVKSPLPGKQNQREERMKFGPRDIKKEACEEILEDYRIEKLLGEGSYGKVKLATHIPTNLPVAIKYLSKSSLKMLGTSERILREIIVLTNLSHDNISRLLQVLNDSNYIYLVLEYASGGELFDYIVRRGRLTENKARKIFSMLLSAVRYSHSVGVVHRDLKPENILMDEFGNIKIIDFGFSTVTNEGKYLETFCGSAAYAAPEMITGCKYTGGEVDIWSMGVILYMMVCGNLPWDDKNITRMFGQISDCKYHLPKYLSDDCKDLIRKILMPDPKLRISINQILEHPWLKQNPAISNLSNLNLDTPITIDNFSDKFIPPDTSDSTHKVVCEHLAELGYTEHEIKKSLESGDPGAIHAAYFLIKEKLKKPYMTPDTEEDIRMEIGGENETQEEEVLVVTSSKQNAIIEEEEEEENDGADIFKPKPTISNTLEASKNDSQNLKNHEKRKPKNVKITVDTRSKPISIYEYDQKFIPKSSTKTVFPTDASPISSTTPSFKSPKRISTYVTASPTTKDTTFSKLNQANNTSTLLSKIKNAQQLVLQSPVTLTSANSESPTTGKKLHSRQSLKTIISKISEEFSKNHISIQPFKIEDILLDGHGILKCEIDHNAVTETGFEANIFDSVDEDDVENILMWDLLKGEDSKEEFSLEVEKDGDGTTIMMTGNKHFARNILDSIVIV